MTVKKMRIDEESEEADIESEPEQTDQGRVEEEMEGKYGEVPVAEASRRYANGWWVPAKYTEYLEQDFEADEAYKILRNGTWLWVFPSGEEADAARKVVESIPETLPCEKGHCGCRELPLDEFRVDKKAKSTYGRRLKCKRCCKEDEEARKKKRGIPPRKPRTPLEGAISLIQEEIEKLVTKIKHLKEQLTAYKRTLFGLEHPESEEADFKLDEGDEG